MYFRLDRIFDLRNKYLATHSRKYGTDFLGREHVGEVVLAAGIDRYHRALEPERPTFQFVGQHEESLEVTSHNGTFALPHAPAFHLNIENRAGTQARLYLVGQHAVVLRDDSYGNVLHDLRREHPHGKEGNPYGQHQENHPQYDIVAEVDFPDGIQESLQEHGDTPVTG
jgi:hypothetical protein